MKGDFSKWYFDPTDNFNGILEQQGRVGLDADGIAQTRIMNHWQDTAAQDVIGPRVAAVPVGEVNSFKVIKAEVVAGQVHLTLLPGRIWADGLLAYLNSPTEIQRIATYLQPPIQTPPADPTSIAAGIRDAVILEVWRDSVNGFQLPETLIEPALGGPDTSERVHTAMALRLYRLAADQTCDTISDQLQDKFASKGKLTVSLQPTTVIPGDCPVVEGGGYTGFEHNLYRIEIAQVDSGGPMFKWSQFNGGLVGRGLFDAVTLKVIITANLQAIATSNLSNFYLEALAYNTDLGYWRVTYGATVTLNSDGELELPATPTFGTIPAAGSSVFFRLWNGIAAITQFPLGTSTPLQDGIRLEFEAPTASNYIPGDYWTFPVRAGEIANPDILINAKPPEGIRYHRVPLAELHWGDANQPITFDNQQIEDCRHPFRPLTNQKVCCTFLVGDGIQSQGDFNSIEEALGHLPPQGGKICLLPGQHRTNTTIKDRQNIVITGCGSRSIVTPRPEKATEPIFLIDASRNIQLDQMTLMANTGTAIRVIDSANANQGSREISILSNQIVASVHAIEIRVKEAAEDNRIRIIDNQIALLDKFEAKAAIFSIADDVLIERNQIVVFPAPPENPRIPREPDDPGVSVFDPCAEKHFFYTTRFSAYRFLQTTFFYVANLAAVAKIAYSAQGGIQIGGGSERIKIINNEVVGGRGNGITLGHIPEEVIDDSTLKKSVYLFAELPAATLKRLKELFVGFLYEIAIEQNAIRQMGLSGIGVAAFFNTEKIGLMVSVEDLTIYRNVITHCAQQIPPELPASMLNEVGFGGIALASCENAVIQENRIENNGVSHIEPVCGIAILMGEKADISNNRVLNNGPRTLTKDNTVRPGLRGGIFIGLSFKQVAQKLVEGQELLFPDGIAAAKIHDNTVTQPLGQALFIIAFGPVSVVGNVLTSQGADLRANFFSFLAGSVFILNLGVSHDLLAYLLLTSFSKIATANTGAFNQTVSSNQTGELIRRLLYLPSGTVLFADNQVALDLRSQEINFVFSSQLIATLDDIAYNSNQSECSSFFDVVLTDVGLFGVTIRSNDNRFQEGVTFAFYSLFSYGLMNTATGNQATHCLHVLGTPAFTVKGLDNRVLFNAPQCDKEYQSLQQHLNVPAQATFAGGG